MILKMPVLPSMKDLQTLIGSQGNRWITYPDGGALFAFDHTYRNKIQASPEPRESALILYPFGKCKSEAMRDLVVLIDSTYEVTAIRIWSTGETNVRGDTHE